MIGRRIPSDMAEQQNRPPVTVASGLTPEKQQHVRGQLLCEPSQQDFITTRIRHHEEKKLQLVHANKIASVQRSPLLASPSRLNQKKNRGPLYPRVSKRENQSSIQARGPV